MYIVERRVKKDRSNKVTHGAWEIEDIGLGMKGKEEDTLYEQSHIAMWRTPAEWENDAKAKLL